jgi:peptidoglycan/LPS O-acetylase OafA/YrhL
MSKAGTVRLWLWPIGLFVLIVVHHGWKQALIVFGVSMAFSVPIALILHRRNVKRSRNEDPVNRRADMFDF